MTTIYLIRHAQADSSVFDQQSRPLTKKGAIDSLLLAKEFTDIKIDLIASSPYKRSLDTVAEISAQHKLPINIVDDFRGLKVESHWIQSYRHFFSKYWNDFKYHYLDGECFADLQNRSIMRLQKIVNENKNKTIVISTHSVSIALIIKYYHVALSFETFMVIADTEPFVAKIVFEENGHSASPVSILY